MFPKSRSPSWRPSRSWEMRLQQWIPRCTCEESFPKSSLCLEFLLVRLWPRRRIWSWRFCHRFLFCAPFDHGASTSALSSRAGSLKVNKEAAGRGRPLCFRCIASRCQTCLRAKASAKERSAECRRGCQQGGPNPRRLAPVQRSGRPARSESARLHQGCRQ